jgi:hypothetical protein
MKRFFALLMLLASIAPSSAARQHRSHAARLAFERSHPCPSTGRHRGRCPGYVVDHIKPLSCGGADAPVNMQWQTIEDAKRKDKWERNCALWP